MISASNQNSFVKIFIQINSTICSTFFIDLSSYIEKNKFETDQSNVCYICQLNRENSIYYIDFDNHVNFDHNVMNYIYFIIYLNVNNVMNFNLYELNSYKMLKYNNIEWIPRVENDE